MIRYFKTLSLNFIISVFLLSCGNSENNDLIDQINIHDTVLIKFHTLSIPNQDIINENEIIKDFSIARKRYSSLERNMLYASFFDGTFLKENNLTRSLMNTLYGYISIKIIKINNSKYSFQIEGFEETRLNITYNKDNIIIYQISNDSTRLLNSPIWASDHKRYDEYDITVSPVKLDGYKFLQVDCIITNIPVRIWINKKYGVIKFAYLYASSKMIAIKDKLDIKSYDTLGQY